MINIFNNKKPKYISFLDLQKIIKNQSAYIIINTMSFDDQSCLIKNTININNEEPVINNLVNNYDYYSKSFVIYGRNANDTSVEDKSNQIFRLGFKNVFIYKGGLFEWLLLQDIYGFDQFPTNIKILDILKYKPNDIL